ncbi:MAG TPA: Clp protease ClpP [Paludibacteraceae bacterium]|nr:Clp protease ClpP [Paludibacteraceae bacterium]
MNKIINKYISAKASGKTGELYIFGQITDTKWYDDDNTPTSIKQALEDMGDIDTLEIRVNSEGGSVFAGLAIIGVIDNFKSKKNCKTVSIVEGLAASMASVIACAADKVVMKENAFMMIHPASSFAWGNSEDLRRTADLLEKVDGQLRDIYMKRFNDSREKLNELVDAETWLTAKEAKGYGLCDEIQESVKLAACANGIIFNNVNFDKKILDKIKDKIKITESEDDVKDVLIYDVKLAEFGISEEDFKALTSVNDLVDRVVERAREGFVPEQSFANVKAELEAKKAEYKNLSDRFEAVRQEAIENAVKNGVRANDKFDEGKWRKRLSNMEYDEIRDISDEWFENAKAALKAGVRITGKTEGEKNIDPLTGKSLAF